MQLSEAEARHRFAASRSATLATVRPDGSPHVVPVVFALVGDVIHTSIDHKPKRSRRPQRLTNLEHQPRCALLVDRYDDDWEKLWWVRADGVADIVATAHAGDSGRAALIERYPAYRDRPPPGPYLRIEVRRWSGWAAS